MHIEINAINQSKGAQFLNRRQQINSYINYNNTEELQVQFTIIRNNFINAIIICELKHYAINKLKNLKKLVKTNNSPIKISNGNKFN